MKVINSTIMTLSLTALALLTMLSIARADDRSDGGHDGGGTRIQRSSREEVMAAYNWVIESIRQDQDPETGGYPWLFYASIFTPVIPGTDHTTVGLCLKMPMLCEKKAPNLPEDKYGLPLYKKTTDYLDQSRIYFEENGPCPAADKDDAVASVSKFEIGADLCLSMPLLRRIPAPALRAQIAAALAHEMTHLLGWGEELATEVQLGISYNFDKIMRQNGEMLIGHVVGETMLVEAALENSLNLWSEENRAVTPFLLGWAVGSLHTIEAILPDGINDNTMRVAKPRMYAQVKKALRDLQGEIQGVAYQSQRQTRAEYAASLETLKKDTLQVLLQLEDFLGQKVTRFPRR